MPADDPVLSRPYGPAELDPMRAHHGIARTVLVQAAPTVAETEYMLGIADAVDSVAAVVGWINFEDPGQIEVLERLSRHPKFRGVRPMIQDIPDPDWMLRDDVQWAFQALTDLDLSFDALGFPIHLDNFLTIFTRYPTLRVVVDHCMKPRIRDHGQGPTVFGQWADGMAAIAERSGAFCKLSGLVTECDPGWTVEDLRPYASHVLEVFGPDRVMFGSDWPVCGVRASYDEWFAAALALTDHLDDAARRRIFAGTATAFYRLDA